MLCWSSTRNTSICFFFSFFMHKIFHSNNLHSPLLWHFLGAIPVPQSHARLILITLSRRHFWVSDWYLYWSLAFWFIFKTTFCIGWFLSVYLWWWREGKSSFFHFSAKFRVGSHACEQLFTSVLPSTVTRSYLVFQISLLHLVFVCWISVTCKKREGKSSFRNGCWPLSLANIPCALCHVSS